MTSNDCFNGEMEQLETRPFSKNIIFLDTEFSTLDPYKGEILSIGLVKFDGEELYLELEYEGETSDFVKKHVLPLLEGPKISREEARERIKEFVGEGEPYMVSLVNQFDTIYFYKLFWVHEEQEQPFHWLPIDFAAILFGAGHDPEKFIKVAHELGVSTKPYRAHHALQDAKLLREVFLKFFDIHVETDHAE